jgi:hypothetical protein
MKKYGDYGLRRRQDRRKGGEGIEERIEEKLWKKGWKGWIG